MRSKKFGEVNEKNLENRPKKVSPDTPEKMVEISAYERERLNNIERNNAVLHSMGLGERLVPAKPKSTRKAKRQDNDDDDADSVAPPVRRSARVAKDAPEYAELSDEFCVEEEKRLAGGRVRRQTVTYAQKQGLEMQEAEDKLAARRAKRQKEIAANLARQSLARQSSSVQVRSVGPHLAATMIPSMDRAPIVFGDKGYYTQGICAQCPDCGGKFVVRKSDGKIRSHICRPVHDFLLPDAN